MEHGITILGVATVQTSLEEDKKLLAALLPVGKEQLCELSTPDTQQPTTRALGLSIIGTLNQPQDSSLSVGASVTDGYLTLSDPTGKLLSHGNSFIVYKVHLYFQQSNL